MHNSDDRKEAAKGMTDLTDRQMLYAIIGDVGSLKASATHAAEASSAARHKVERLEATLTLMNSKIDQLLLYEARMLAVEAGVSDYRGVKNRLIGMITGVGLAAGAAGSAIASWVGKAFGMTPH
jgi:hypothetical protein